MLGAGGLSARVKVEGRDESRRGVKSIREPRGPARSLSASLTESAIRGQSFQLAALGREFDDMYVATKEPSHIFGGFSTLEESAPTRIVHNEGIA